MVEEVLVSVPGRVCLAGEFLDWMTGPSVMSTIDLRLFLRARRNVTNRKEINIYSSEPYDISLSLPLSQIGNYTGHKLDFINASLKVLYDYMSESPPVNIDISSRLPAEGGLSSSAAVTLATISAVSNLFALDLSVEELCQLSYKVEAEELRTGAGQMDYYSCTRGNFVYINCSTIPPDPIEVYHPPDDLLFIVVDTLTPRRAKDVMLNRRKLFFEKHPSIMDYISLAEPAVLELRAHLQNGVPSLERFGQVVTSCHYLTRDYLNISTKLIDECVQTAISNNALGAKLSGAGTGGCMFILARIDDAKMIAHKIGKLPVRVYIVEPSRSGITIY